MNPFLQEFHRQTASRSRCLPVDLEAVTGGRLGWKGCNFVTGVGFLEEQS